MKYSGRFTNGPDYVFATSLVEQGYLVTVKGYRSGNYKFITNDGDLAAGGASFAHKFVDTWSRKGDVWLLQRTDHSGYLEPTSPLLVASSKAHAVLKKTYLSKR